MHKCTVTLTADRTVSSASFPEIRRKSILPSQLYTVDTYEKDNTVSKNVKKQNTLNWNKCVCLLKTARFTSFSVLLFQTPVRRLCGGSLLPLCGLDENDTETE